MSGEQRPPHEELLNAPRPEIIGALQFDRLKENALRALPPQQEGQQRAALVRNIPTSEEDWLGIGVRDSFGENVYNAILLSTIEGSARSPVIASSMLDELRQHHEQLHSRINPELASITVVRLINTLDAHPIAVEKIVRWAVEFMPEDETQKSAQGLLKRLGLDALAMSLLPILEKVNRPDLVTQVQKRIDDFGPAERERLDRLRQAAEARVAEAARRQALRERQSYIRNNPIQAFTELIKSHNITKNTIETFEFDGSEELLLAAHCVNVQSESGEISLTGQKVLAKLASALLDKALQLQREGASTIPDTLHILHRHEERRVASAPSLAEFKKELIEVGKWREFTPAQMAGLYDEWRHRLIQNRKRDQAKRALNEFQLDPNTDLRPAGVDRLDVTIGSGSVVYGPSSIEKLFEDMRSYFTPELIPLIQDVVAANNKVVEIKQKTGSLAEYTSNEDREIMARIEQEVRERNAHEGPWEYRLEVPSYEGRTFDDQWISIKKDASGHFLLSLRGGYHYTEEIEKFAAYTGNAFVPGGPIKLKYRAEPPAELVPNTFERSMQGVAKIKEGVDVSLPVGAIMQHLQRLIGVTNDTVEKLWRNLLEDTYDEPEAAVIHSTRLSISARADTLHHAWRNSTSDCLEGKETIFEPEGREEHRSFFLPELEIRIESADPDHHATIARLFHAIGIQSGYAGRKKYSHGSVVGNGRFQPNQPL